MDMNAQELVARAKAAVQTISCRDFLAMRSAKQPYTLIDVREQDEWDAGHIAEAIHIPRGLLEFKIAEVVPDKQAPIILQCASGGRAALCGQALREMGYQHVQNLEGGYAGYCAAKENS